MAGSNFVDYVKIYCRSGKGGAGSTHFHREKFIQKGGPDGGDGGRGGHVILRGNKNYWTLIHLKYARHIHAGDGEGGSGSRSFGKDGQDKYIDVPCGTVVYDAETGECLGDITEDGQEMIMLKGGRGGLGNWHFRTATLQTPRFSQPGEPRIEKTVILQLKVLADVGLVGFPNAGKSTLLSVLSAAKPEIADYPFTTLVPSLGVVRMDNEKSFVVADIPGLIEGAAEGAGLGIRFLKHLERCRVLLHLIDIDPIDGTDPVENARIIISELEKYSQDLAAKPRWLVFNKIDLLDKAEAEEKAKAIAEALGWEDKYYLISAASGLGVKDLCWDVMTFIIENPVVQAEEAKQPEKVEFMWDDYHRQQLEEIAEEDDEDWDDDWDEDDEEGVEFIYKR